MSEGLPDVKADTIEVREVDTLWTIPNLFTLLRLLCLPVFVWLLFGAENRQAAAWMLGALGATDWVDGYLARRLGQTSEFGKKFDPTVDRLLFVVALIAIMIDGSMPVWFGVAVLVREVVVGARAPCVRVAASWYFRSAQKPFMSSGLRTPAATSGDGASSFGFFSGSGSSPVGSPNNSSRIGRS